MTGNGAYGAATAFCEKKIKESILAQSAGFVTNGGHFPTKRLDGTALQPGDYVKPSSTATFPLIVDGVEFKNKSYKAIFVGSNRWESEGSSLQNTEDTELTNKSYESFSGTKNNQAEVNQENKLEFGKRELLSNKLQSFDDLEDGDIESYPSAHSVKVLNERNISSERKVAGHKLDQDITIQQIVDAFKNISRTYKNVTIDCDDNTLREIVFASCFKSGQVLTTMPSTLTTEEYVVLTAKGIYDFVRSQVQGAVKIKGKKAAKAEIEAITDMQVGDEWFCQADSHFWLYTEVDGWVDTGGTIDLSNYLQKTDVVDNLTTNDSQRPLSAGQGKVLKELVDTKQDKIDLTNLSDKLQTLNPTHVFSYRKLQTLLGMTEFNIDAALPTPIINKTAATKEIAKLPVLPTGYSYPGSVRIECTTPSGYHTCEENRESFYDDDGDHYINPNIASGAEFHLYSCVKINDAHDDNGNEIYIAEQLKNHQNLLIVGTDGAPAVAHDTVSYIVDGTAEQTPDVFVLKFTAGAGYSYVDHYIDGDGNRIDGAFYMLQKITPTIDKVYMYKCYLMNKMLEVVGRPFLVDEQGRLCTFTVEESQESLLMKSKQASLNSYFNGLSGTITITPIYHNATYNQIGCQFVEHRTLDPESGDEIIDYYSLMTHGSNVLSNYCIQKTL